MQGDYDDPFYDEYVRWAERQPIEVTIDDYYTFVKDLYEEHGG